ncbi:metallophosphoesterase [Phenylobacterium sp.]|uniref:metallophosphoesterase family protein n=1 Tax=Phenylobacterium sp. TaxID=1871053 RepID=UPI0025EBAF1F|nr:metallophosphoesterase [Phenylobacterium sp.]
MTAFRLAHLSDPHLPPPPLPFRLGDLASKRLLSRFAWRRKRHRHAKAVLDAVTADLAACAPDHLAITGDLTNFATPEEFAAARAWLGTLGDPSAVTVSPGNHDALVGAGGAADFSAWTPWLGDAEPGFPCEPGFPKLRVRGPVALVNLCSAVPTSLHLAQGRLGRAQIERAAALLRETRGLFRVVLVHHPVTPGMVSPRKSMTDAADLRAALAAAGAELVLHGHAHAALLSGFAGPDGPIPVLGVPSASTPAGMHDQAARWNEIEIARDGAGFRAIVTVRGVTAGGDLETLGRYELC